MSREGETTPLGTEIGHSNDIDVASESGSYDFIGLSGGTERFIFRTPL
jgi:hypothetical protein